MGKHRRTFVVLAAALSPLAFTIILIGLLSSQATASPQACFAVYYVDHAAGCGPPNPCYTTIQAAVDDACPGSEIRVAQGTYTDIHHRSGVTQVVYISKSVTIRGGYSSADWSIPHPVTQPTVLDAQGQGRVLYLIGDSANEITPTLEGLRLTSGRADGSNGGGVFAQHASMVISACHIYSNSTTGGTWSGGGLFVEDSNGLELISNRIYSNTASGSGAGLSLSGVDNPVLTGNYIYTNTADGWAGGGLYAYGCPQIELDNNRFFDNLAASTGGGMWISHSDGATLRRNQIHDNTADGSAGGGVYISYSDGAQLIDNQVYGNTTVQLTTSGANGGGVYLATAPGAQLSGNRVYSNSGRHGGGIYIDESNNSMLTDNWIYDNTGTYFGGGVHINNCSSSILSGNEIHGNGTPVYGGGVYINYSASITVENNHIHNNQASSRGGGIVLFSQSDHAILRGNRIHGNSSGSYGGGIHLEGSDYLALLANQVYGNDTPWSGAGIDARGCHTITLENNLVTDNKLTGLGSYGAGLYFERTSGRLLHTTLARNNGGHGQAVYLTLTSTVGLDNSIIVSHEIGVETSGPPSAAWLDYTLWGSGAWANISDTIGSGIVSTNGIWQVPGFHTPDDGDYHIAFNSPARDAGVDLGVVTDVDGDSRVANAPPDLGADEYGCYVRLNDTPYASVQLAIDASTSPTDVVRVAGACRGIELRGGGNRQVAYVNKDLTVRGGYSRDFAEWDPIQYPTTLDALWNGHVVYLYGDNSPHLEWLRLVNGQSSAGGGVVADQGSPVISGCQILDNSASIFGGGLYVASSSVSLVNTVVADNRITLDTGAGAGIFAIQGYVTARHATMARNTGGTGAGIMSYLSTILMTNTILVDHAVAISTALPADNVQLESTLWGSGEWANDLDWGGPGTFSVGSNNYWLEPGFVDADNGDYHLTASSPAVDLGTDASVSVDMDGHPRPAGLAPDLGADEFFNDPPVANAGLDQTVEMAAMVALDGSGSSDPDGHLPLSYLWSQDSGPAVTFSPNLSITTFAAPTSPTVLTFTLTVTDSLGLVDATPDQVVISVERFRIYLPLVLRD